MKGKEKCKALREIRRKIAEENDIAFATEECKFKGDCKGTCPKCESELIYLERELDKRVRLGKAVALTGIAVGALGLAGCTPDYQGGMSYYGGDSTEGADETSQDTRDIVGNMTYCDDFTEETSDDDFALDGDVMVMPEFDDSAEASVEENN